MLKFKIDGALTVLVTKKLFFMKFFDVFFSTPYLLNSKKPLSNLGDKEPLSAWFNPLVLAFYYKLNIFDLFGVDSIVLTDDYYTLIKNVFSFGVAF